MIYFSGFTCRFGYCVWYFFFESEDMRSVRRNSQAERLFPAVHRVIFTAENSFVRNSSAAVFKPVRGEYLSPLTANGNADAVFGIVDGTEIDNTEKSALSVRSGKNDNASVGVVCIDPLEPVPSEIALPKLGR